MNENTFKIGKNTIKFFSDFTMQTRKTFNNWRYCQGPQHRPLRLERFLIYFRKEVQKLVIHSLSCQAENSIVEIERFASTMERDRQAVISLVISQVFALKSIGINVENDSIIALDLSNNKN